MKSITRLYSVWLLAVAMLCLSAQALAADAGRMLFVRGDVRVVDASGMSREVSRGNVVREEERIITGLRSAAQVRLSDGALLSLRSSSEYLIEKQRFNAEEKSLSAQAGRLFRGFMRSVTGAIGAQSPGSVSHTSPVATIGIRGTVFQLVHVPPEGLAEFPGISPGSYMMVESGQTTMQTAQGQIVANPGDVFFVADENSAPQPAPEMRGLFRGAPGGGAGEGDQGGESTANGDENDGNDSGTPGDDALLDSSVRDRADSIPPLERVGALSIVRTTNPGANLVLFSGEDDNIFLNLRTLVGQEDNALDRKLGSEPGRSSGNRGSLDVLDASGNVATQVYWGRWSENAFDLASLSGNPVETNSDWHYMYASNVLTSAQANTLASSGQLTGAFRYDYVSGTDLTAIGDSARLRITSGAITADFSSLLMDVDLGLGLVAETAFGSIDSGTLGNISGSGTWQDFFANETGGIQLATASDSVTGSIAGRFAGDRAEALISTLAVTAETNEFSGSAIGTAAFLRGAEPATVDPQPPTNDRLPPIGDAPSFANTAGLSALTACTGTGCASALNLLAVNSGRDGLEVNQLGDNRYFSSMTFNADDQVWDVAAGEGASPVPGGSFQVTNDSRQIVSEVYWGIWAATDVTLASRQEGEKQLTSDWRYMVASQVILPVQGDSFALEGLPLSGTFDFPYQGGTGLRGPEGALELADASRVRVDFLSQSMDVDLSVQGALQDRVLGQGSFEDLYRFRLGLEGDIVTGLMGGGFVGGGEGVMTALELQSPEGEGFTGAALFADRIPVAP